MFNANQSHISLSRGHKDFMFSPDGITIVPRASFEISHQCPEAYINLIIECMNQGWLKPVANMRETEYTMELLRK